VTRAALTALALAALLGAGGVNSSGADFTASSTSPSNSFTAAADFNTVAVTMTDPGSLLRGTVALGAVASSDRGIDSVLFQSSPAGAGAWTDACTTSSAPYSCDWNTGSVASGARDVRAVATDLAGYQRSSAAVAVVVDNTAPVPVVTDPGYLQGTETITATASDADSGVAMLAVAYRPAGGGSWTTLCSGAGSPQSCPLATIGLLDGGYELRARTTDAAGNAEDAFITRTVDNNGPTVSVVAPPTALRGSVTVAFNAADGAGSGVKQVGAELRSSGSGAWAPLCTDLAAPYECAGVDTTQVSDGLYDVRAIAEDDAGLTTTSSVITVRVDNTPPPAPTLTDPGANLQGSVALNGTATDVGSGIAAWVAQYRPAGGGAWADACTGAISPYGCNWVTTGVTDGLYDLRAVARDQAGNETPSSTIANRRVDNNGPAVTLIDPGAYLRGTVALSATANDPAGVQSVVLERKLASGGPPMTICTDTTAPYTCSFNTSGLDGTFDLSARATDTVGRSSTSTVGARVIDNTPPAAAAVEAVNAGGTAGRLNAGDWLRLTWTEPIAPASVLAGWDGSPLPIRVELQDVAGSDRLTVWNGTTRLNLTNTGGLRLNANFVATDASFDATLTRSGAAFTITLGTRLSGTLATAAPANIRWTPSNLATDLAGNPANTTAFDEPNPADVDF
jgi:chitinase